MQTTKTLTLAATAALSLAVLTGCSGTAEPTATPDIGTVEPTTAAPVETTEAPVADSGATVSERGNQIITVGTTTDLFDIDLPVGSWTIESITPADTSGSAFAWDANTTYLLVTISAETTADLTNEIMFAWEAVDAEGFTVNETIEHSGADVLPEAEELPARIGPGEKVRGSVLVGAPTETGTLIIKPFSTANNMAMYGYEVAY